MRKNKSINRSLYAALAVGAASTLLSCSDDIHPGIGGEETDVVCFRIDNASWGDAADTRSGAPKSGREIGRAVMRAAGSRDTLCVRAIETDGIDLGSGPSTRGNVVSNGSAPDSFGCFAYVGTTSGQYTQFYINNDEYIKDASGYSSKENIQYWPGDALKFKFYCYAPYSAVGLSVPQTAIATRALSYSVPTDVSKQQDLMMAVSEEYPGNHNKRVPLTFRHLLSAVRIVAGDNMMAGTVKSISFSNLYGSANINMDAPTAWSGYADYRSFTYAPVEGVAVTGTANQEIMAGANTMLMLPQDMQPETSLEPTVFTVVFYDGTQERTLQAELTGEWQMGKTYTYRLSITPEYELEFTQDNPVVADAHYSIVPIKIRANELNGKEYTLVSSDPSVCKLRAALVGPEEQGYWPKETTGGGDFARSASVASKIEGENTIYAFLNENASEADRAVELQLQYDGKTVRTLTINQKCPNWNANGLGWESIEEDGLKPFGFAWTRKVTYQVDGWANVWVAIIKLLGGFGNGNGITWGGSIFNYTCTLDYSQVQALTNVYSPTDGLENTKHFSANNASNLDQLENYLKDRGHITSESGDREESSDFAALVCLKKNACDVNKDGTGANIVYAPSFSDADIKWYLPASGQFTALPADMNGKQYWSSTAINDNANAYSWNGSAVSTPRMTNLNVRAARVKD